MVFGVNITKIVAKMAKESSWPDVCLLSFDLQTVEFAYALVIVVLIIFIVPNLTGRLTGLYRIHLV